MPDFPMTVYVHDQVSGELVPRPLAQHEYPSQIVVFCDGCGEETCRDYVVSELMTKTQRLEVARASLRREGWSCDEKGDYCPSCRPPAVLALAGAGA